MKILSKYHSGQALITLLFFISIAITVTTAAVVIVMSGNSSATAFEEGTRTYYAAEAGIENALIRILRDPAYTGETLPLDEGEAVVTVSGTGPYVILSRGVIGDYSKTLEVQVQFVNYVLTIISWKEI